MTGPNLDKINFVIGRISNFDMQNQRYPHWTKIREIQEKLAENDPNGAWVDTDDRNGGKPNEITPKQMLRGKQINEEWMTEVTT